MFVKTLLINEARVCEKLNVCVENTFNEWEEHFECVCVKHF